ncbi:unnamed protein product [Closterium sp. Naga37s-1]|nr:unnamed protein product [Closterium sp. Naga37s-1]CAI5498973.1 unnamed protein product [Closterium sp. Naga37s-1]
MAKPDSLNWEDEREVPHNDSLFSLSSPPLFPSSPPSPPPHLPSSPSPPLPVPLLPHSPTHLLSTSPPPSPSPLPSSSPPLLPFSPPNQTNGSSLETMTITSSLDSVLRTLSRFYMRSGTIAFSLDSSSERSPAST